MSPRGIKLQALIDATGMAKRTLLYIQRHEPGVLPRDKNGLYLMPDCAVNLRNREVEKEKRKAAETAAPDSIRDANRRQAIADAALSELKLDRERGKVIEKAALELELRDLFRRIRTRVLAIRLEHKHRFVNLPDEAMASKELHSLAVLLLGTLQQAGPILGEVIAQDPAHETVEIPVTRAKGKKTA